MVRWNNVVYAPILFLPAFIFPLAALAEDLSSSAQTFDTGEHYFERQNCTPFEFTEIYNECGCKISAKYVQLQNHPTINELLKPLDTLEKYCDYDYEQGLDDKNPHDWQPVNKEHFINASIFEYNIHQSVSYLSDRWLNVVDHSYVFSGGAHGTTAMDSLLFDLKSDKQMDIAALIDPAKIADANRAIQDQLNARPEGEVFEEFRNLQEPSYIKEDSSCDACVYVLKDSGIYAVFQQYGVGPYSSGFVEVKLPDDVLTSDSGIVFQKE